MIELAAVGGAAALAAALAPLAPGRLWAGEAVLFASGLFLLQSLLRDVAIWLAARRAGASAPARPPGACMCVESTLGGAGVLFGAALMILAPGLRLPAPAGAWPVAVALLGLAGFFAKNWLVDWRRCRIRRAQDGSAAGGRTSPP